MKEWIVTEFEKKHFTVKCDEDILNDGIGSYEFWGTPGFDKGVDYISGVVSLFIRGDELKENIINFIDVYEDEIKEVLLPEIISNNLTDEEPINFFNENGVIEIYIEYGAEVE